MPKEVNKVLVAHMFSVSEKNSKGKLTIKKENLK